MEHADIRDVKRGAGDSGEAGLTKEDEEVRGDQGNVLLQQKVTRAVKDSHFSRYHNGHVQVHLTVNEE